MHPAAALTAAAIVAGCAPHVLVLTGRLPHRSLGGGRIVDERRARTASAVSLPILAGEAGAALWAGRRPGWARPVGSVLAAHAALTLVLQLAGTGFERRYLAPLCAVWLAGASGLAWSRPLSAGFLFAGTPSDRD